MLSLLCEVHRKHNSSAFSCLSCLVVLSLVSLVLSLFLLAFLTKEMTNVYTCLIESHPKTDQVSKVSCAWSTLFGFYGNSQKRFASQEKRIASDNWVSCIEACCSFVAAHIRDRLENDHVKSSAIRTVEGRSGKCVIRRGPHWASQCPEKQGKSCESKGNTIAQTVYSEFAMAVHSETSIFAWTVVQRDRWDLGRHWTVRHA